MYGRSALVVLLLIFLAPAAAAQRDVSKSKSRKTGSVPEEARREGPANRFDDWRVPGRLRRLGDRVFGE